jgi:hypothetical protein
MNDPRYQIGTKVKVLDTFRNGEIGFIEKVTPGKNGTKHSYTVAFIGRQLATFSESGIIETAEMMPPSKKSGEKEELPVLTNMITPGRFDIKWNGKRKEISYKGTILVSEFVNDSGIEPVINDDPISLIKNGDIEIWDDNIAIGNNIKELQDVLEILVKWIPKKELISKDVRKEKGLGTIETSRYGNTVELHWYRYQKRMIAKLKIKWVPTINLFEERVEMDNTEKSKRKWLPPPKGWIEPTKKTYFKQIKVLMNDNFKTEDGIEIRSETLITILKELKTFITKNDPDGFFNCVHNHPKRKLLSDGEKLQLQTARIITGKGTVFDLISDIADLDEG